MKWWHSLIEILAVWVLAVLAAWESALAGYQAGIWEAVGCRYPSKRRPSSRACSS